MTRWFRAMAATAVVGLLLVPSASAHHVMGGELPRTAWQGLLSGLGHPIIGVDHLAFVVGVGLLAALAGRALLLPLPFVAGTVLGCFVHLAGYMLPWAEAGVAVTVALAAVAVGTRAKAPIAVLAAILLAAGALHGYAYGESIVGAEREPLAAYLAGFGAIQYVIALGSAAALRALVGRDYVSEVKAARAAGGALAVVAVAAFVNAAVTG